MFTSEKSCAIEAIESALLDAGPYFGMVEVEFVAEWEPNPLAGMPLLADDEETTEDYASKYMLKDEYIRFKRIHAHRFRVASHDSATLEKCDWVGYYDFILVKDLKKPYNGFKNVRKVLNYRRELLSDDNIVYNYSDTDDNRYNTNDRIKVWRIWDNLEKKFYIFTDGDFVEIYSEDFERLPLFPLVFHRRRRGFYPIPWFFNWKSPQDEINESREQIRSARRRAKRMWTALENSIDIEELDKLISGPDGTIVWVKRQDALQPVAYPPLDASIGSVLQVSKDDFNIISGTSSEQRGLADRTTATQAAIVNQRAQIRDNEEREVVATWLCRIAKEALLQARERFTTFTWVKKMHDLGSFFQEMPEMEYEWRKIQVEDLGTFDISLSLSVESLSPIAQDQEKRKFMEFLAILGQYQIVAIHPELIAEAAYRTGYRNRRVIRAFQQAAVYQMAGQLAGLPGMNPEDNPSSNIAQQTAEQMTPPTQAQLEGQMDRMGLPQE